MLNQGEHLNLHQAITKEVVHFFWPLFFEDNYPALEEENLVLACIPPLVSMEMNNALLAPISLVELEDIVFHMKKGKAPGPDGFPIEFFQKNLDTIKTDFLEVVWESYTIK